MPLHPAPGKDAEITAIGVDEWGQLTDLAHRWLRAYLTHRAAQAKNPSNWALVRGEIKQWKSDRDLIAIRDPAWLAAMPPGDRKRWEQFWADADALLATVSPELAPPPREVKKP